MIRAIVLTGLDRDLAVERRGRNRVLVSAHVAGLVEIFEPRLMNALDDSAADPQALR